MSTGASKLSSLPLQFEISDEEIVIEINEKIQQNNFNKSVDSSQLARL